MVVAWLVGRMSRESRDGAVVVVLWNFRSSSSSVCWSNRVKFYVLTFFLLAAKILCWLVPCRSSFFLVFFLDLYMGKRERAAAHTQAFTFVYIDTMSNILL